MKKIKNNYTNFILTVIAVAMIGILLKGEKIITSAHALDSHRHKAYQIWDFKETVEACRVLASPVNTYKSGSFNSWNIRC